MWEEAMILVFDVIALWQMVRAGLAPAAARQAPETFFTVNPTRRARCSRGCHVGPGDSGPTGLPHPLPSGQCPQQGSEFASDVLRTMPTSSLPTPG